MEQSISEFIQQYEKVSKLESKLFAEVFTPRQLIEEMLDTLPKEVWKNKDLKWLDPAVGIGNFPSVILDRLMTGLVDVIPNEEERRKHILEEMLYMIDISTKNLFLLYMLFDKNREYKLNVYRGSFLEDNFDKHMKEVWKLNGFDVVVGNPPYQDNNDDGTRKAKNHSLWRQFIHTSYKLLSNNGFLLFVTPQAWMSPSRANKNTLEIFTKNNLIYMNISECQKYFPGVGSTFCYYLVNKSQDKTPTSIKCLFKNKLYSSNILISDKFFCLPQLVTKESISIFEKTVFKRNEKFPVQFDSDLHATTKKNLLSSTQDDVFRYKIIHTPSQTKWSSVPHKTQDKFKVFLPISTYFTQIIVDRCGNTQGVGYIICDDIDEGNRIKSILMNKLYQFITEITRWSNWNTPDILYNLPKLDTNKEWKNSDIYDYFNLSQEEIDLIENTIKD
jgi:adenine-specific DNA-methyltransferase